MIRMIMITLSREAVTLANTLQTHPLPFCLELIGQVNLQ